MNFFAKSRSSGKFKEKHLKTYILPTLYGVAFGSVCILLLGIAFASTNNAVYFLCFLLTVLGVQSLVITNENTEKLVIQRVEVDDFFADESGFARIALHNPTEQDLHDLTIEFNKADSLILSTLHAAERQNLQLVLRDSTPGEKTLPPIRVSSDFPFHFARSWKKHYAEVTYAVFPARLGQREFAAQAFTDMQLEVNNLDDFKSHREYNDSDSPRRIDWKVTARLDKMMVKEFDQQTTQKVTLRYADCTQADPTQKLCQLSLWIDLAEKNNFEYALTLPRTNIEFGRGPQHRIRCLRSLT